MTEQAVEQEAPQPTAEAAEPQTAPPAPAPTPPAEEPKPPRSPEDYEAEIQKLRKESAGYRTKLREAEPVLKEHQEREEANKTELQREREAREAIQRERDELQIGYTRLELAAIHNIPPDDIELIGSGTREEMEARAARLGVLHAATAKTAPPPSDRPVEGLRPGASPEPPRPEDDSYPESWKPAFLNR